MRPVSSLLAVLVLGSLIPSVSPGQATGLSITNLVLVNEVRVTRTVSDFQYRADIVNTGVARAAVTATVTSSVPSVQVIQGTLHFVNVPANGRATSTDTFVLRIDRSVAFNVANLVWTFSAPGAPVANAGPNQTVAVGGTATLNGSGSTNPSGVGTLSYSWAFTSRPAGSAAVLLNPTTVNPSFVVDRAGSYVIALTVSNGVGSDTASVTVSTSNTAPVANAGTNQSVSVGATVTLDGSLSSDVDGNPLTYLWTLTTKPASSTAVLSNSTAVKPTFTADKAGSYTATLVVNDGTTNSNTASVTVSTVNTPPVANPGPDQTANVGANVQLSGAGSTDVDGDPLTYRWSFASRPEGSTAVLSSLTVVNPTFTVDREGTFIVQLIVNDGKVDSQPRNVSITTNTVPAPTANAGPAQTVKHGSLVQLSGSGTDPQSRPLTFLWSFNSRPAGSTAALSSTTIANPTFTADRPGDYVLQLIVNNGFKNSTPSTVTITTTNSTPVANPGANQTATLATVVTLNGSGSTDADGDALTFAWSFTSRPAGSTAALSAATSATPTFVPDVAGSYIVQLIVSDAFTSSSPATVTITTAQPGQIILPATTTLSLGQSATFAVSLSTAAPPAGVTVTLVIGDPTKASLTTLTVPFAAGATLPVTQPQVSGVGLGSTTISATAPNYVNASGSVQVNATVAFTPGSQTIIGTATQNFTLTLSAPAPTGGVTVNLSSSNTAAATVPSTVTFGSGATTATVPVTGVAAGSTTITASAANIAAATASVTVVNTLTITTASLPNGRVNVAYSQNLGATGGVQPYAWTLTSGTLPAGLTLASNGLISGTPTAAVTNVALTFSVTDAGPPAQTKTVNLTLTIDAAVPASITVTSGSNQSAPTGAAFAAPLVATVRDAGGNPVGSGITVTFTPPASGASGTFAGGVNTATTNGSGVATSAVFTANSTVGGPYVVNATVAGVATPAAFSLTNTQRQVATLTATSGGGQTVAIGTQFPLPLVVTATDSSGQPVPNATVTFTVPSVGASAAFTGGNTAVTNASGVATSNVLTANLTAGGPYVVSASVPGVTAASFSLTNATGPASSIIAFSGTPQSVTVGQPFGSPLVARVRDAGNNPVQGVQVAFTAPGSGASGTFPGGLTTASAITNASGDATSPVFTANATAGGPYNVAASVAGVATPANFALTNNSGGGGGGTLAISSVTVGNGLQAQITLTLPQAAPAGGLLVNITSGNTAVARVAGRPNDPGTTQITFTVGEGQISVTGIYVQGFANSGTAQLTASANGFTSGTATATASPAGFVISGPGGIGAASFSVPVGTTNTPITVSAARLNGSFGFVETQQLRGGTTATVTVSSAPTAVGTIPPPGQVTIAGGDVSAATTFSAVATGSASITAGTPSGFSTPVGGSNTVTANVTSAGLVPSALTVGQNLQAPTQVLLNSPTASPLTVTVTSTDAARVLFSTTPTGAGQASISLTVDTGRTITPEFYVYGLASSGTVAYNVSAPGYTGASANVTLVTSGFVITGVGIVGDAFNITSQAPNQSLDVLATRLDAGCSPNCVQALRGGVSASVPITSSNTSLGTITASPLSFTAGVAILTTEFDPIAPGTVTITAGTPSGFSTPASGVVITATITAPAISVTTNRQIGRNLQITGQVSLGALPPAGGVNVTITSNSGSLLLANTPNAVGSNSITVNIPENTLSGTYYIFVSASTGNATYTATAPGFAPRTGTIQMVPSGVVISGPFGFGLDLLSTLGPGPFQGAQPVTLNTAALDPVTNEALEVQALAGNAATVSVALTNSTPATGTVTTPVSIVAGSDTGTGTFTPLAVGVTTLGVTTPAGYTQSSTFRTLIARVQP